MGKKMNKTEFIKLLSYKTKLDLEDAEIVNKILEDNFFISRKNKNKIVNEIVLKLNINIDDATNIYGSAKNIFNEEISNKLRHPFRARN